LPFFPPWNHRGTTIMELPGTSVNLHFILSAYLSTGFTAQGTLRNDEEISET